MALFDLGDQISSQLSLVDLQHNNIQKINTGNYSQELILVDNPYCEEGDSESKIWTPIALVHIHIGGCLEYQVPVSSVSVLRPHMNDNRDLQIDLEFFPARKVYFDVSEVFLISSLFNNQNFTVPPEFGPYHFRGQQYIFQAIICLVILHKKRKAKGAASRFRFSGLWNLSTSSSSIPQLTGPRIFLI
ncbi:hypothetical protein OPV22_016703 [Ensete ventricosum]|uniref:Uncharacterized protein n=1 Tax=Ensete ventricosum TaxID=4639 RepID=A0AAV8R0L0_ENSVE|nr:hypothetical protein OPV22_016703 [Ensete ventricosum]